MTGPPFVSCLCVTHGRPLLLRRAIDCFLAQTHESRELLVLHEDSDPETAAVLAGESDPRVRGIVVKASGRTTLGARRNMLVASARGDCVAIWDDDDWHAPDRLAQQLRVMQESGLPACTIQHLVVFDQVHRRAFISQARHWEGTLLSRRSAMPAYAELNIAEDRPAMDQLERTGQVASLANPALYIYVYHGANTGSPMHFASNIFTRSTRLSEAMTARIAALLASPGGAPLQFEELLASREAPPAAR